MSRTDKDRPWQIRAADRTASTRHVAYYWHNTWQHERGGSCNASCGWTLPHIALSQPPHDYVLSVWSGPERARERVGLSQMAAEYNTYGDLSDGDFANYHHRHSAQWLWF